MSMRNRNEKIDALRGMAACLVVIAHAIQINVYDFDHNIVVILITSFFMPLFMFVSGLVSYKPNEELGINILKKRAIALLPPFFSYTLINYFVIGKNQYSLLKWFIECLRKPDMSLWFLWVLFLNNIFMLIAAKLPIKQKLGGDISYVTLAGICIIMYISGVYIEFGLSFCIWYLPFFFAGILTVMYKEKLNKYKKYILSIATVLFLPGAWRWRRAEIYVTYIGALIKKSDALIIYDRIYNYFIAFIGIACCIALIEYIFSKKVISILAFIGKYSLGIYFFNVWILSSIRTKDTFINIYVGIIVSISVSIVLCKILEKNNITRLLILGKGFYRENH